MRKAPSTCPYYDSILLLLFLFYMQNTGAYSFHSHSCNPNDLGALYGFSRSLVTQIHDWPLADASYTNCCSWPGVYCALFSSSPISSSSSSNSSVLSVTRVVGLDLSGKGLEGVLSTSLAVLDKLSFLDLSYNSFRGPIPPELFHLKLLKVLDLGRNRLSGELPLGIANLTSLHHLDVSDNRFTGNIPDVFHGLQNLEVFSAKSNGFVGRLPASLSLCSMLTSLDLWNNSLDGSIDLDFGRLVRLTTLNLGYNRLQGLIPEVFFSCKALNLLNLSLNKLSGQVPKKFSNLRSLSYLNLNGNSLSNISDALQVLQECHNLTVLGLTQNFQGEEMPGHGIRGFPNLRSLTVGNCGLTGSIPSWLRNCRELRGVDVSSNHLSGEIPSWFGGFDHLFRLILSNNSFYGEIPVSLTELKSLTSGVTLLQDDDSSSETPLFYWYRGKPIDEAFIYNSYTHFPPALDLSHNRLNGSIWKEFGNLKYLHLLDLSWNNFSGSIPEQLSSMVNLERLDLSYNDLSGSIPSSLARLTFMSFFQCSLQSFARSNSKWRWSFPCSSFERNPGLYSNFMLFCNSTLSAANHKEDDDYGEDKFVFFGVPFAVGLIVGSLPTLYLLMCWWDQNYEYD